jgi:hypothetical protein
MNDTPDYAAYEGYYATYGFIVGVRSEAGELLAAAPGVPPGYEMRLQPLGDGFFRIAGGPLAGAVAQFRLGGDGRAEAIVVGPEELSRIAPDQVKPPEPHTFLRAPEMKPDLARDRAFADLFQSILDRADGSWIDYRLPYPKHEFLRFATGREAVLFHGSGKPDIDEFRPERTSYELRDRTGRGNRQAVYATHDALWSVFFAIVDRPRLTGSIRNGVQYYHNRAGEPLALYNFSINRLHLAEQPWRAGTLYFLPRASFVRIPLAGEALSNEWASPVAVKPLARLRLEPEDFPFLHQIGGHDDGALLRFNELEKALVEAVTAVHDEGERLLLTLRPAPELAGNLAEFLELQREFVPAAEVSVIAGEPLRLTIRGPAAYMQTLSASVDRRLAAAPPPGAAND